MKCRVCKSEYPEPDVIGQHSGLEPGAIRGRKEKTGDEPDLTVLAIGATIGDHHKFGYVQVGNRHQHPLVQALACCVRGEIGPDTGRQY